MFKPSHHSYVSCTRKHFIRPVLFAFFKHGDPQLKAFVKQNISACPFDKGMDEYARWLTAAPGDDVPNHLKLYWWISTYRNR